MTYADIKIGRTYYREGIAATRKIIAFEPPGNLIIYELPKGMRCMCWASTFILWATGYIENGEMNRVAMKLKRDPRRGASEAEFQQQVIQLAKLRGWRVAHFRSVCVARKNGTKKWMTPVQADGEGFPDLILIRGKQGIAWELKVGSNKPTDQQREWIAAFDAAGFLADVLYPIDWPSIEEALR